MVCKKGFSLVEVIVAAGIFGIVITGGFAGVRMGFEVVDNSRHFTRVSQILQSEVESLRSLSWKELNELPDTEEIDVEPQFVTSAYDGYTLTRIIDEESATVRRVVVQVNYTTRGGKDVSLSYVTFFSEGGLNDYYYRTI